jgi:hypothetical protein
MAIAAASATSATLREALGLIASTPGYSEAGEHLARLAAKGRIRVDLRLPDRARAGLLGAITLGPEAVTASAVSLAQTLVHEHYHGHQNPLLKTVSFWLGVATRTPVMRRYEQPAYQAAVDFLEALKHEHPRLAAEAQAEQDAVRQVFALDFGAALR